MQQRCGNMVIKNSITIKENIRKMVSACCSHGFGFGCFDVVVRRMLAWLQSPQTPILIKRSVGFTSAGPLTRGSSSAHALQPKVQIPAWPDPGTPPPPPKRQQCGGTRPTLCSFSPSSSLSFHIHCWAGKDVTNQSRCLCHCFFCFFYLEP